MSDLVRKPKTGVLASRSVNPFCLHMETTKALTSCACAQADLPYGHYDNTPMQHTVIVKGCKNGNFQMKNCDISLIFVVRRF